MNAIDSEMTFEHEQGPVYAAELDAACKILERVHPLGQVKAFGRLQVAAVLADLFPADDGEPLDDEYLRSVGFKFHADDTLVVLESPLPTDPKDDPRLSPNPDELLRRIYRVGKGEFASWHYSQPHWWNVTDDEQEGSAKLWPCETRGHLRAFAKAFGIALPEAAP